MKHFNQYDLKATVYPSIVSMIIPFLLTCCFLYGYLSTINHHCLAIVKTVYIVLPVALVYAAIGFYFRQLFLETSKSLLQDILYEKNNERMPTTEILLWKNELRDDNYKKAIRDKIKKEFMISLSSKEEEKKDCHKARVQIVGAVDLIKTNFQEDQSVLRYNIRYGFWRNYFGGSVWALLVTLALFIINLIYPSMKTGWIGVGALVICVSMILAVSAMKSNARNYAFQLFASYLQKEI